MPPDRVYHTKPSFPFQVLYFDLAILGLETLVKAQLSTIATHGEIQVSLAGHDKPLCLDRAKTFREISCITNERNIAILPSVLQSE